ncbi:MAG TPA: DUF1579 domain-containing protein [Ignavibacteriaceae bacterium]|nr:DUF1579 domain-containing protein [Ignavibacteriaceae bacterium]
MLYLSRNVLIFLLLLGSKTFLFAQDAEDQAAQMQIWTEYMTPGPMHQMLASQAGDWKTISRYWMDPAGEPMETEGTGKTEMILGGRYQKSTHKSMMMGMPTEGIFLMGYDNATQEFTAVWIDNIGTGTAVAKGRYDESTNSITLNGAMVDPMSKQEVNFREVLKFLDDDNQLLEMYVVYNDQEFKSMEIEFVRQ